VALAALTSLTNAVLPQSGHISAGSRVPAISAAPVLPFRDNAAVGVTTLDIIMSLLPNPELEEKVEPAT
jgi:hypothetical protein